jgi:hypothetical protein
VIAAGMLRQGRPPSLGLPREFALAVTAERVVAFAMSWLKEADGLSDCVAVVRIKPGERGSWPRASARLADVHKRMGTTRATLHLGGAGPFRVTSDGDPSTKALFDLLSR